MDDKKTVSLPYFEKAFAEQSTYPLGYSPFSVDDYRDAFDEDKLLEHLTRPDL